MTTVGERSGPVFWARQCLVMGQRAAKAMNAGKTGKRFFLEHVATCVPLMDEPGTAVLYGASTGFSLEWMQSGYPTFECSPKLAAAYMATKVHPEATADLQMPWEAFLVDVPPGLLPMTPSVAVFRSEHYAALMKMEGKPIHLLYVLGNEKGIQGINSTVVTSLSGLASKRVQETSFGDAPDEMKRYADLVDAYVLNLLLDLGESPKVVPSGHRRSMRQGKLPKKWVFKFNKKIQVDCRPFTRAYLGGERKSPTVQTLARGHRKMQPHGPGNSLRKRIWIEPYWRGPLDAPISARTR